MTGRPPVVVTDLDRTFSDAMLRPVPSAIAVMAKVRRLGVATILATGRTFAELQRKRGILGVFDFVIAEGGGLIGTPTAMHPLRANPRAIERLHLWLNERSILHERGTSSLSISRADLPALRRYPKLASFQVTPNRNRADVTLAGVDKGRAVTALRRLPALRGRHAIGFGDGENDLPLFAAVDRRIAVRNAVPALQRAAHEVTRWPGGRGVADYLVRNLLSSETSH